METHNLNFSMSPEVYALGVSGVYLMIEGLENRRIDGGFEKFKEGVLAELVTEYRQENFIKDDLILEGFRQLHSKVGRSNRRFVSAPEGLVNRLIRSGTMSNVSLMVDIYNLVSLKTRLALGAHDIEKVDGNITLRLTDGSEKFIAIGSDKPDSIFPGEYAYVDDNNDIICRLEVLQVEKTKVDLGTVNAFYIIQGSPNTSHEYLRTGVDELVRLTKVYCGGKEHLLYVPK